MIECGVFGDGALLHSLFFSNDWNHHAEEMVMVMEYLTLVIGVLVTQTKDAIKNLNNVAIHYDGDCRSNVQLTQMSRPDKHTFMS